MLNFPPIRLRQNLYNKLKISMKKTFKFILPQVAYFEDEKHPFLPLSPDAKRNLYEVLIKHLNAIGYSFPDFFNKDYDSIKLDS